MDQLSQLGQYGLIGVMLALIGLAGSSMWINYKQNNGKQDRMMGVIERNSVAFATNAEAAKENTIATRQTTEALAQLKNMVEIKLRS